MKARKKNEIFQLISNNPERGERVLKAFWARVDKTENGCWTWNGSRTTSPRDKYGLFTYEWPKGKILFASAHRLSLMLHTGKDEELLDACHTCDNPPCVRPDHLFWGTHKENMVDRSIKMKGKRSKISINEDAVVRACQAYERDFSSLGKYKAMHSAIQVALDDIFRGDPHKIYIQEIKNLRQEIDQLKEEILR